MPYLVMLDFRDGSEPRISEERDSLQEAREFAQLVRQQSPTSARVWIEETVVPKETY